MLNITNNQIKLLVCSLICCSMISCKQHHDPNEKLFSEIIVSLEQSNLMASQNNTQYLHAIEKDLDKMETRDRALRWQPIAKQAEKLSNELVDYIQSLEKQTKENSIIILNEDILRALYFKLLKYKKEILLLDSSIKNELSSVISLTYNKNDTLEQSEKDFYTSFTNTPVKLVLIKNRVIIVGSIVIEFCNKKLGTTCGDFFERFSAIISQSSTHFKQNEVIEINAGVGAFSKAPQPEIIINGKPTELNADGVAIYKQKVSSSIGKHKVPVRINFKLPNGKIEHTMKEVEYTVDE